MLAAMKSLLVAAVAVALAVALAACSSDSQKTVDAAAQDSASDTPGATMMLASPAFAEGGTVPTANTCNGANTSPALAWTGAPAGTRSFAVVLTDLTISMAHWVIFDIPPTGAGLPAGVENVYAPASVAGAHQIVSIQPPTVGYYGPCPPRPPAHTYQFTVHALDTATLPGVSAKSTRPEAVAAIQAHRLGAGSLTGVYTTPP
jgi:Raf kinase inhibitor-like YbhB/YbcL family protein